MNDIQKLVQEIASYCNRYNSLEAMPIIEVDILKQKTRELYDKLSRTSFQIAEPKKEDSCESAKNEQVIENQTIVTQETIIEEPIAQQEPEPVQEEIKVQPTPQEQISKQNTDSVFSKEPTDLGSRLSRISELTTDSFVFNDRIHYRASLFNNDKELFAQTLEILNNSQTFDNALQYLRDNFDWDFENHDVKKFITFVKRRFI